MRAAALFSTLTFFAPRLAQADESKPQVDEVAVELPPVPEGRIHEEPPQPSWDTGLLLSACGVGEGGRTWAVTKFCLGGVGDVMFFRKKEDHAGLGAYAQLSTAGFRDFRMSAGAAGIVSLIDWFSLGLRAGALGQLDEHGFRPGGEVFLELGHRSVSLRSAYGLSHAFFGGLQYTAENKDSDAGTAIWIGLRLDGVWLTAPKALF